eukprot:g8845.t1
MKSVAEQAPPKDEIPQHAQVDSELLLRGGENEEAWELVAKWRVWLLFWAGFSKDFESGALEGGEILTLEDIAADMAIRPKDLDLAPPLLEAASDAVPSVVLMCPKRMDKRLVSACIEKGAKGYVSKPLRVQAIRGVLLRYADSEACRCSEAETQLAGEPAN